MILIAVWYIRGSEEARAFWLLRAEQKLFPFRLYSRDGDLSARHEGTLNYIYLACVVSLCLGQLQLQKW